MAQPVSVLAPDHDQGSAHLLDNRHVASETGPTRPQPAGASAGDEPHRPWAADMNDEEPDNNKYYIEDYYAFTEDPNRYKKGGFHPVRPGDRFGPSGRYRVFNKLGFGGWGTVWLCRDTLEGKWRALKITSAYDKTKPVRDAYRELMIKQHFDLSFKGDLAHHHICIPSEYFWISGPNGHHLCSIMPVFGPPLTKVYRYYGLHLNILKDVCFQLAQSLEFLHSHGICHGDFPPDNILFRLADGVDEWSEEDINRVLRPPEVVNVYTDGTHRRDPSIPAYVVSPRAFKFSSGVCSSKIAVVDFGVAYHVNTPPTRSGIPFKFAAPERLLVRYPIGFTSDIWSLACTMSAVFHGYSPFNTDGSSCRQSVLGEMQAKVGPLPKPYRSAWNLNLNFEFENDENNETLPVAIPECQWAKDKEELKTLTTSAGLRVDDRLLFPFVSGNSRLYINALQAGWYSSLNWAFGVGEQEDR